jgi:cell division protein FtsA
MAQYTAILDIGSSKIVCLIGGINEDGRLVIYGSGTSEYAGFRHGEFKSAAELGDTIAMVLDKAQTEAKRRIRRLVVGVPGAFSTSCLKHAQREVEGTIKDSDVSALIDDSLKFEHPANSSIIHSTPVSFSIDGTDSYDIPTGAQAKQLGGDIAHIFVSDAFVTPIASVLEKLEIKLELLVSQLLATGLFLIPAEARSSTAGVVDVGYWHTDVGVMRANALVYGETLGVGGAHFASDVAYGLNLPIASTEMLKRRYVFGLDYAGASENVKLRTGAIEAVDQETVQYIIEERAKELSNLIQNILLKPQSGFKKGDTVYLTGGGLAMMRGSREFLEMQLETPVELTTPWAPILGSPNYVSAYSVLDFAMKLAGNERKTNGILKALWNFFSK